MLFFRRIQRKPKFSEVNINFKAITSSDELWRKVRNYAESCSWRVGKALASRMDNNGFSDWERVIAAKDGEKICGYCMASVQWTEKLLHGVPKNNIYARALRRATFNLPQPV